jgi:hypothetical protein
VNFSPAVSRDALKAMLYCTRVMRQAAASFMPPDPWPVAGRP